jgi:hypothetical protein
MFVNALDNTALWHPWIGAYYDWVKGFYQLEPVFRRGFVQHPKEIPISAAAIEPPAHTLDAAQCQVGLCFLSQDVFELGTYLQVQIQLPNAEFCGFGEVAWVQDELGSGHWIGVCFSDSKNAFTMKMAEQICQIEHYRHDNKEFLGRELSQEEAAQEWVARYASVFSSHI